MTLDLGNRKINENGEITLTDDGVVETLFSNQSTIFNNSVEKTEETEQFNHWAKIFGIEQLTYSKTIDHKVNQEKWLIPEEFLNLDIEDYVLSLCKTQQETVRVTEELSLYKERNLYNLLKFITYIVAIMRDSNIIFGVGRGSSVSSYVLFLLGLHKVNSIKYALDIKEFLK